VGRIWPRPTHRARPLNSIVSRHSTIVRELAVFALITLSGISSAAGRPVDLDQPGALESIQKHAPERYAKILEILREAEKLPCDLLPQLMAAKGARSNGCELVVLMPSNPPKRRILFTLQGTNYEAAVTTSDTKPELLPKRKKNAD